jgi:hypothetical protein
MQRKSKSYRRFRNLCKAQLRNIKNRKLSQRLLGKGVQLFVTLTAVAEQLHEEESRRSTPKG